MMRPFRAAIMLCLLTSLTAPAAAQVDMPRLQERMQDINAWIRLNTAYRARHLPKVVIRTEEEMARKYFGPNFRSDLIGWVAAMSSHGVIILPPGISADGEDDDVLVHELVHFQQFEAGKGGECRGRLEEEAYELQDKFVESTGRGKKSDPMTVASMALSCETP
jgi:hypothetical protein